MSSIYQGLCRFFWKVASIWNVFVTSFIIPFLKNDLVSKFRKISMTNLPLLEWQLVRRSSLVVVKCAAILRVLPLAVDLDGRLSLWLCGLARHGRRDDADLVGRLRSVGVFAVNRIVHRGEWYLRHQSRSGGVLGDQSDIIKQWALDVVHVIGSSSAALLYIIFVYNTSLIVILRTDFFKEFKQIIKFRTWISAKVLFEFYYYRSTLKQLANHEMKTFSLKLDELLKSC